MSPSESIGVITFVIGVLLAVFGAILASMRRDIDKIQGNKVGIEVCALQHEAIAALMVKINEEMTEIRKDLKEILKIQNQMLRDMDARDK